MGNGKGERGKEKQKGRKENIEKIKTKERKKKPSK